MSFNINISDRTTHLILFLGGMFLMSMVKTGFDWVAERTWRKIDHAAEDYKAFKTWQKAQKSPAPNVTA